MSQPDVATDYAVVADGCIAAENCCTGIDYHIISYVRVALYSFYGISVLIGLKALGPESYALIKLDAAAYDAGFAYNYACSVINEEIGAYRGAGVYVYACHLVGVFGHHSWEQGNAQLSEAVGEPVYGNGVEGRIGQHYLLGAFCGGVTLVRGLHVCFQHLGYVGERGDKIGGYIFGLALYGSVFAHNVAEHLVKQDCSLLQVVYNKCAGETWGQPAR